MTSTGCGYPAIDVDLARSMILDKDGVQKDDAVAILTETFGPPHGPTKSQIERMREHDRVYIGKWAAKKKDYSTMKVWGNDRKFIGIVTLNNKREYRIFGGKPLSASQPKVDQAKP